MPEKEETFVLGVDLDGTVADFYGGIRLIAAEWLGKKIEELTEEVQYGLPEWGFGDGPHEHRYGDLHRFAVTQRSLFTNLKPFPGAPQALRRLSRDRVLIRIITHRLFISQFHQLAVQQTIEWLDRHGIPYRDLCFMEKKTAVDADLYIEDKPENVTKLREAALPTIVFTNSTNKGKAEPPRADNWEQVEVLVHEEIERWKANPKRKPHA